MLTCPLLLASIKGCNQPKTKSFDDLTNKPSREKERKERKEKKTKRKTKEKKKRKREKREGKWTAAKGKEREGPRQQGERGESRREPPRTTVNRRRRRRRQ